MKTKPAHRRKTSAVPEQGIDVFEEAIWYSAKEICRRLSVSRDTVVRWGQSGSVRAMKIRGNVRYLGADLNALMEPLGAA